MVKLSTGLSGAGATLAGIGLLTGPGEFVAAPLGAVLGIAGGIAKFFGAGFTKKQIQTLGFMEHHKKGKGQPHDRFGRPVPHNRFLS